MFKNIHFHLNYTIQHQANFAITMKSILQITTTTILQQRTRRLLLWAWCDVRALDSVDLTNQVVEHLVNVDSFFGRRLYKRAVAELPR